MACFSSVHVRLRALVGKTKACTSTKIRVGAAALLVHLGLRHTLYTRYTHVEHTLHTRARTHKHTHTHTRDGKLQNEVYENSGISGSKVD
jgi:rRNA-processing protein FCF1